MKSLLRVKLEALRTEYGYGEFDHEIKSMGRERLQNPTREKRQHFTPSMYRKLFDAQLGICPECQEHLDVPADKGEIDHKDPNRQDFNHPSNLQLLHKSCNREKSAMTIQEQSKAGKGTFEKILRVADEQEI